MARRRKRWERRREHRERRGPSLEKGARAAGVPSPVELISRASAGNDCVQGVGPATMDGLVKRPILLTGGTVTLFLTACGGTFTTGRSDEDAGPGAGGDGSGGLATGGRSGTGGRATGGRGTGGRPGTGGVIGNGGIAGAGGFAT